MSFIGDYPVESQPYWGQEFKMFAMAIEFAKIQHKTLCGVVSDHRHLYTIVIEKDNDEMVLWIIYQGKEINNMAEATKLADQLFEG
jgi:alkaline phosphatase